MCSRIFFILCGLLGLSFSHSDAETNSVNWPVRGQISLPFQDNDNSFSETEFDIGLGVKAPLFPDTEIKARLDLNEAGDFDIEDAFVERFLNSEGWSIRIGQHRLPGSLDAQTSSLFSASPERSQVVRAFGIERRLGTSLIFAGQTNHFAAGLFTREIQRNSEHRDAAFAGRATHLFSFDEQTKILLGGSLTAARSGDKLTSTFAGIEASVSSEHWWAAGEIAAESYADAVRKAGYLETGYFFGGKRVLSARGFRRPKVAQPVSVGGFGAINGFARWEFGETEDRGLRWRSSGYILGANWWLNERLRIRFSSQDKVTPLPFELDESAPEKLDPGKEWRLGLQADF